MTLAEIDTEHLRALIATVRDEGVEEFRYGDLHIRFAPVILEATDKREMDPELFVKQAASSSSDDDVMLTPLQRQYAQLITNIGNG